jgi:hypothetical protein
VAHIYVVPTWLLGLAVVFLANALALGGLTLVWRRVPVEARRRHNDAAGAMVGIIGVVYAVILAFIAVEVWQDFDRADDLVGREADQVGDIWRDARAIADPARGEVREALRRYAQAVTGEEWAMQRHGATSGNARAALEEASAALLAFEPATRREEVVFAEMLRKLNALLDERRLRLQMVDSGVQPIVWVVLLLGTGLVVVSTYFFGVESFRAHLAMSSCVATAIGLIIFLILALDYPFRGGAIEPAPFEAVLRTMSAD